MTISLDDFFAGGGGKSVSWKDKPLNSTVSGTIKMIHQARQQTDPLDGSLVFQKDKVTPKMSVRIDLDTNFRNFEMMAPLTAPPTEPDDGERALYVQGSLQYAIGDALRKAGRQGPPEVGGTLSITLVERVPNENRALNPTNKFNVVYTSPAAQATQQFFGQPGQQPGVYTPPAAPVQPQYAPQPSISGQGYAVPPQPQYAPQQAAQPQYAPGPPAPPVQQAPVQQAAAPQRPEAISEAAWNTMDPQVQANVANTFAGLPPF